VLAKPRGGQHERLQERRCPDGHPRKTTVDGVALPSSMKRGQDGGAVSVRGRLGCLVFGPLIAGRLGWLRWENRERERRRRERRCC
jgi:hypothetical protein